MSHRVNEILLLLPFAASTLRFMRKNHAG